MIILSEINEKSLNSYIYYFKDQKIHRYILDFSPDFFMRINAQNQILNNFQNITVHGHSWTMDRDKVF